MPRTRSSWRPHKSCATAPPIEYPTGINVEIPRTSATAAASSAQSSSLKVDFVRIPRPWPRMSIATTRKCSDNASKHVNQFKSVVAVHPCKSKRVGAPAGPVFSRINIRPRPGRSISNPGGKPANGATDSRITVVESR